jgi:superfamily II DNA/RNA helicase
VLATAGVPNVLYHKNVPKEQRDAALTTMLGAAISSLPGSSDADGSSSSHGASSNAVMVSTDAAARGIDLPDITHVIQADFSQTAIEFLHRVGRTARAGKGGKVTSLFGDSDSVLVGALRQYINDGKPIEDCFSRNRSFSKKVKRYGKFVPRGQRP